MTCLRGRLRAGACARAYGPRPGHQRRGFATGAVRGRMDGCPYGRASRLYPVCDRHDLRGPDGRTGLRGLQSVLRCACVHRRGDTRGSCRTPRNVAGRPAHLVVPHGGDGRLHPRQPAELDLLALRPRSLPVVRRRILPRVLPAAVRGHPERTSRRGRPRAMGTSGARRHDPDAGLRRVLLVLRDRTDFSRRTRSRRRQVRPDARPISR